MCLVAPGFRLAGSEAPIDEQLRMLVEQNRQLMEQVQAQQRQINELRARINEIGQSGEQRDEELRRLRDSVAGAAAAPERRPEQPGLRLSGIAGFGLFRSGAQGATPNSEFSVDEAKLFVETPVARDTYLFGGLDLRTREGGTAFALGEFYLDFENVSGALGGRDGLLNVRAGRFNIPFGEEYLVRNPVDDPLITHSVGDFWGLDQGVELYGRLGRTQYVVAVQNGGISEPRDFNSDKSVSARLAFSPAPWSRLSVSAMRTGQLDAGADFLSQLWVGNGFFRSIGAPATTTTFQAELYEVDAQAFWTGGSLRAAGGAARYADNDTAGDNSRRLRYGYVEAVQTIVPKLYGAVRLSELRASSGYPLVGLGNFNTFFFAGPPTTRLWRLSLGLGYRFNASLLWKIEYAIEQGELTTGAARNQEDLLATEIAVKF